MNFENKINKTIISLLPLFIILFITLFLKGENEIIISHVENLPCDNIIKEGMKIESINGVEIKSIDDFEKIKNSWSVDDTLFLVVDGKITKCKYRNESIFEVKLFETQYLYNPINLERLVIKNTEKNRKILDVIGYNYYLIDKNEIVLPYNQKLKDLLSSEKDLKFYLEITLEKENDTVRLADNHVKIDDLYTHYDEIIIFENNVTLIKYLFNQNNIKNFDFIITYLYPLSISHIKLIFEIDENASKNLKENLKNIPFKLIQFEKFYDAKLVIKIKNITVLSYYLPYKDYENSISLELTNIKNPKKIREEIAIQLFDKKDILEEKNLRIFTIEVFLILIMFLILIFYINKVRDFSFINYTPLIIFSLVSPLVFIINMLLILLIKTILTKKIYYENLILLFVSSIIILNFILKTFISIYSLALTFIFLIILEIFRKHFNRYEILIYIIFLSFAFATFFFNPLISFSIFLILFIKLLSKNLL